MVSHLVAALPFGPEAAHAPHTTVGPADRGGERGHLLQPPCYEDEGKPRGLEQRPEPAMRLG
jgi:hypothetical protein